MDDSEMPSVRERKKGVGLKVRGAGRGHGLVPGGLGRDGGERKPVSEKQKRLIG